MRGPVIIAAVLLVGGFLTLGIPSAIYADANIWSALLITLIGIWIWSIALLLWVSLQ